MPPLVRSDSEAALVRRVQSGDRAAFDALYTIYRDNVYTYCYRVLNRDAAGAQDAMQDAFMKAYQSIASIDHPQSFRYWLFTIVRHHVFGLLRSRHGQRVVAGTERLHDVADPETPQTLFEVRERNDMLLDAIDALKTEEREALLLREFEHMSYAEIAAITDSTLDAVRARLFKARKHLASMISEHGGSPHDM